jgi:hypothetical protein
MKCYSSQYSFFVPAFRKKPLRIASASASIAIQKHGDRKAKGEASAWWITKTQKSKVECAGGSY